ncbi:MAG TPA: hypothetical protein VMO00_14060 [Methylomirabilota bacterium]|nr:hypothetical protein [Methylomirabilota bacterium]
MFEKNNWLVPMLNGQIYADKPVQRIGERKGYLLRLPEMVS